MKKLAIGILVIVAIVGGVITVLSLIGMTLAYLGVKAFIRLPGR